MCQGCYQKEKQQALDYERPPAGGGGATNTGGGGATNTGGGGATNTAPVTTKPPPYQRPPSLAETERQNTIINQGKSKFYTYANEDHSLVSKDASLATHGADLNNMKTTAANNPDKKAIKELARSTFYIENTTNVNLNAPQGAGQASGQGSRPAVPSVSTGKPPVNVTRTGGSAVRNQLPLGTAYIANDLNYEVKMSNREKCATLPARIQTAPKGTEDFPYADDPPVRGQFGGHGLGPPGGYPAPSRATAFKIKGSVDNVQQLSAAVSSNHGYAGTGMTPRSSMIQEKCRSGKCEFYGTEATDFLCSSCYKSKQRTLANMAFKDTHR